MSTTSKNQALKAQRQKVVRRLLVAVDRAITAADEARRARDELFAMPPAVNQPQPCEQGAES